MAVGEKRVTWMISQVSWTDGTAQDVYYWQEHSFQYSANINCDDEMHGIKLASKAIKTSNFAKCDLISWWDNWVYAMPVNWGSINRIRCNGSSINSIGTVGSISSWNDVVPWTIFQDYFWCGINLSTTWWLYKAQHGSSSLTPIAPFDHPEATDESISDPDTKTINMPWQITAILNYNNTRLVVAAGSSIWIYYPELDRTNPNSPYHDPQAVQGQTGWKRTLDFEAGVTIVALTCTFEYLKVWAVDEGWNTKVYYYQGNNNLRSTFVYNVVDLTWERVLRAYSINGVDYFVTSIDGTDGYVNLNKMIGNVAVPLFHQRAWLTQYDINDKAPYFVWPTGIRAAYKSGRFYIADAYGVFQFKYTPQGYDKGYMKWLLKDNKQVYWVCENGGFLYVSYADWCVAMRLYDTWVDGYQSEWVLISREFEGKEWGTVTKMLDEIRLNYELNPLTTWNWTIDVYVSPNNLWRNTSSFTEANNWYHAMHISQTNWKTRTEKSNLFNNLGSGNTTSFDFDWQTITYAIVINLWSEDEATPIVRQIDLRYHVKDKTNNVYDIN